MWEFILAAVFSTQACGMGFFVRFVALQAQRKSMGPSWLRWVGLVIAPVGVLTGFGPLLGGFWVIGALGYSAMFVWWLMLVAYLFVSPAKERTHSFLLTSKV